MGASDDHGWREAAAAEAYGIVELPHPGRIKSRHSDLRGHGH
jgi:hypothetical protein